MTKSELFIKAHTMTKATIKTGDNYSVTFGACLKFIKSGANKMENKIKNALGNKRVKISINTIRELATRIYGAHKFSIYSEYEKINGKMTPNSRRLYSLNNKDYMTSKEMVERLLNVCEKLGR